jgi:hypothetical protein
VRPRRCLQRNRIGGRREEKSKKRIFYKTLLPRPSAPNFGITRVIYRAFPKNDFHRKTEFAKPCRQTALQICSVLTNFTHFRSSESHHRFLGCVAAQHGGSVAAVCRWRDVFVASCKPLKDCQNKLLVLDAKDDDDAHDDVIYDVLL